MMIETEENRMEIEARERVVFDESRYYGDEGREVSATDPMEREGIDEIGLLARFTEDDIFCHAMDLLDVDLQEEMDCLALYFHEAVVVRGAHDGAQGPLGQGRGRRREHDGLHPAVGERREGHVPDEGEDVALHLAVVLGVAHDQDVPALPQRGHVLLGPSHIGPASAGPFSSGKT